MELIMAAVVMTALASSRGQGPPSHLSPPLHSRQLQRRATSPHHVKIAFRSRDPQGLFTSVALGPDDNSAKTMQHKAEVKCMHSHAISSGHTKVAFVS